MHSFPQIQPGALNYAIPAPESQDETQSAARKIAFWFGVGLVFVRFSMLNELLSYVDGRNFYLLYLFGIPALLGLLVSGGITRVLRERAAILWLCFGVWAVIAIPFSIWRGGFRSHGVGLLEDRADHDVCDWWDHKDLARMQSADVYHCGGSRCEPCDI